METPIEKPDTAGTQRHLPSGPQCHKILAVVQATASRSGMKKEDCEDLAHDFLVYLLLYLERHPQIDPSLVLSPAWLARAASNWTRNGLRTQRRRQHRELALPTCSEQDGGEDVPFVEIESTEPSPYREAVQAEFRRRLLNAIIAARLTSAQLTLLEPYLDGENATSIARSLGRPPDTIRHSLRTIRTRLLAALQANGLGDAEIAEFLSVG